MIEQHSHQQQGADEQEFQFPPPAPPGLPPTQALSPLAQLEAYLAATTETQQQQQQSSSPSPNVDEILRVADYLLLDSSAVNKNLLQSSLTILDEQPSKITQFTAPSGRSLYLVKGSKRETYLCLNFASPKNNNNKSMIGDYCSCRSFWEQHTKQQHSSSHSHNNHNKVVCKHFLALALMHPLQCQPNQIQLNSDDEFAYLVLERMSSVGGGGESSSRSFQRY